MSAAPFTTEDYAARMARVVADAEAAGLDGVLVTPGPDLVWLTGYRPTAITERLTALLLTADREPTLLVPTLERPDAEPACVTRLEGAHVGLRREEARLDRVRVTEEDAARLGQGDRARASRALDEPEPDDALEGRDLLRDGRLRVAEPLGSATERPLVGDRLEGDEVAEVEAVPAIRLHDRMVPEQRVS